MRKRKVIKRGENSFAIALMKHDMEDFELSEGSYVDIDDINLIKEKKK